ncbi:transcription-repair-coupling factor [Halolactibacillus alkaliphilus]|uniref:Transcription-repair-coupling factor n=1 Tax=Halolactibacillus alkaliphilus TaxID=442899 RepID=A0A511X4Y0_9BACI|nr:transcription-repair coupling factor [Halolactibacillus alkaliphilus]GEN58007.1 transcription-repair-coupling factor [Halolactibacillus alkaliphilus]GGN76083.1 transcription-repair-coupling factor [Halolactibacillus alkaliphilus]SFP10626.1 transcription-repair coupling factor (superfamily II helicase) [Halolactibacillus alkaliphilus]
MREMNHYLLTYDDVLSMVAGVNNGMNEQQVSGLPGSARSLWMATIQQAVKKQAIIVTHHLTQAQQLVDDLADLIGQDEVFLYPVNELIGTELSVASPELKSQRIKALADWTKKESGVLIAPVAALKRVLPPKDYWEKFTLSFALGEDIPLNQALTQLVLMGYERVDMVEAPGEFSMRGGILDVYPMTEENPLRIEFFDEEVDSIRYFQADSQRSLHKLNEVFIYPNTERLLTDEDRLKLIDTLKTKRVDQLKIMQEAEAKAKFEAMLEREIDALENNQTFDDIYKYNQWFYDQPGSLVRYLADDGLIFMDELGRINETLDQLDHEEQEWIESLLMHQRLFSHLKLSYGREDIEAQAKQQKIYLSIFMRQFPHTKPGNIINVQARDMQEFHGQMPLLKKEIVRYKKSDYSVVFMVRTPERAEKVQAILKDYQIEAGLADETTSLPTKQPVIMIGQLDHGFELPLHKLAVITDRELFKSRVAARKKSPKKMNNAERIKSYQELKVDDYVVHVNHGIGQFIGVETLEIQGMHKDFMLIQYTGDDKLYVPIDQIDLVQKYVGSEGKEPKLYKLGGSEWKKVKRKVQSKVEDIADDLIKLYAEREASVGYQFSEDHLMQREFEDAFPYQETDDQIRSIEEIKQDMQKARPMDRLLCGDVGYGKTEVALRAAFKAIAEGKQVAFLVPTTILAQQHFETALERFQDFPVEISILSRFRTRKQQTHALKGLKDGSVDLIIGTHRLLSKDVQYKDLGLLIVDEEQRFGVKHKEKIKTLKANVDVLTLTATPIPRTLHMSMLGVRDLSVIETPPADRFPIQTYVVEYNPLLLREAIERETGRGGQVFFLYNRVETIEQKAREIESLVEGVRVGVAHGQMNETELENVMHAFLNREYDVLVSTTIIETGVDIPNVNTLIVDRADRMGLSQLYQLRGRVGRSNRIAYAYFTYLPDQVLTEVATKRLQAIKEFTELGSGFKIAMRDLSIRGAGNILGAQQHGFIESVGFDLYSEMLKEAVERRKQGLTGETVEVINPELQLKIDAYIPDMYISDGKQKINMYKRFRAVEHEEDLIDLKEELVDRYGDYPIEVEALIDVTELRMYAKREKVELIKEQKNNMFVTLAKSATRNLLFDKLASYVDDFGRMLKFKFENNQVIFTFTFDKRSQNDRYSYIKGLLLALKDFKND